MTNVSNLDTHRNGSTALVVVDQLSKKEVLEMHTSVKGQGRGAISNFVHNDTPYSNYSEYYVALRKKGVAPFKPRGPRKVTNTQVALEDRIQQLEMQLAVSSITPAKRALEVLYNGMDNITYTSRKFLCSIIQRNTASLSPKQEKWLSNLENDLA